MARVTVEDCLQQADNRFDLVLIAARRARGLRLGEPETQPWNDDKATVLSLREIAAGDVTEEILSRPIDQHYEGQELADVSRLAAEQQPEEDREEDEDDDDLEEGIADPESRDDSTEPAGS